MNIIERGNTKRIRAVLYDEDGELVNADTGTCTVNIWFQNGDVVVSPTAMTLASLGNYTYLWTILSTAEIGIYNIQINATFGSTQIHVNREQCYVSDIISGE